MLKIDVKPIYLALINWTKNYWRKKKKLEEVYFFETVFCALEKVSYVLHENGMLRDYI